jgi:excinuclease ABC subunit C
MPIRDLKEQIGRLPEQPGVYLYFNDAADTLYVGRARVLRDRVRSYLGAYGSSPRTDALLDEVTRLEVIVTDSLVEALALENNLIKQRAPRYNILLRDDKNYPYLQVTTTEAFPRVLVARQVARDGNFYAGPFLPATFARKTMSLTHRLFGIRSCNEVITGKRGRACLEYDIKRCVAPCVEELCSQEVYAQAVDRTRLFLDGRNDELLKELHEQMQTASEEQHYEQAAQFRDTIRTVETLRDRQQKMATARLGERDAIGVKVGPSGAVVQVFQVRLGRVVERVELVTDDVDGVTANESDVVRAAVQQFYEVRDAPAEVHLPLDLEDRPEIEKWLSGRAGRRVVVRVPKRGDKRGLVELASRNASVAYAARYSAEAQVDVAALEELREVLGLPNTPRRLECFDISTIQGSETVGSLVVNEDGRMQRREYRKFRVRGRSEDGTSGPDDFAAMEEVVLRRYRRLLERGGPFPDLVIVDGGLGQLTAAYKAFEQLGLSNLVAIGIAKKEELLVTRDRDAPIALSRHSAALLLVQRIRDEAHRFAVTFHRRARAMRDFSSELDGVTGIGPKRRRALLQRFGSLTNIGRATREELVPVVGPKAAMAVIEHFQNANAIL